MFLFFPLLWHRREGFAVDVVAVVVVAVVFIFG